MEQPSAHGQVVRGASGTVVTDGFEFLHLEVDEPATITSVESVGGSSALEYIGAMIAGPERSQGGWSLLPGFPPTEPGLGPLAQAEGASILPRSQTRERLGYELLLGYRIKGSDESATRREVKVTYEIGDETFIYTSPGALVFCPDDRSDEDCIPN